MPADMRRGLTAAMAGVTGTYFPGCLPGLLIRAESQLQVPGVCLDATETPMANSSQPHSPHRPNPVHLHHLIVPTVPSLLCPPCPGDALPRMEGYALLPAACWLPCGPQMGPVVPGIPAGAGSQRSPHGAGSACSPPSPLSFPESQ